MGCCFETLQKFQISVKSCKKKRRKDMESNLLKQRLKISNLVHDQDKVKEKSKRGDGNQRLADFYKKICILKVKEHHR